MKPSKVRPVILRNIVVLALLSLIGVAEPAVSESFTDVRKKMGSRFEVTAVHSDAIAARAAVEAAYVEIDRLEEMISSWRETSETSAVNHNAGKGPVQVSQELFNLIRRSLKISELTGGAFDVTFAGAGKLWNFKDPDAQLPDPEKIKAVLRNVDYRLVKLDAEARTVELERPGMRIGFGAIGKGYAANRATIVMKEMGIENGVVNAGGDLVAFGRQEDGSPWTVAIADPQKRDEIFAYLQVTEQAVVTSGDYESFIEIDGIRYAHILDPRTGYPVRGVRSVTVICPDGELADALATSIFVMGREKGLDLIDRLTGVEALVVESNASVFFSKYLEKQLIISENSP